MMREQAKDDCSHEARCQFCPAEEMRCGCGNLLARLVSGGVELKCRRCKRTIVLSLSAMEETGSMATSG
jgi:phage FluMu protein Com